MTDQTTSGSDTAPGQQFEALFQDMTDSYMAAVEQNMDAQATLIEQWTDAVQSSLDEDQLSDGYEGMMAAYDVWMDAAEDSLEKMSAATEGEDVSIEEFRDTWLTAANTAFKEVMSTTAFAAMTGETTDAALDLRQEFDEAATDTLATYGFATREDIQEVGERLVELERRQHAIEKKLDKVLDHLE